MAEHVLAFDSAGSLTFIYDDALVGLLEEGESVVRRASHVEPASGGGWIADMGPVEAGVTLGPFRLRSEALAAERQWLVERMAAI